MTHDTNSHHLSKGIMRSMTIPVLLCFILIQNSFSQQTTDKSAEVPMTVLSMSIDDHPSLRKYWWRQVIPSFFETHLDMLNITLRDAWDGDSICRPRYFGLMHNQQVGHEQFLSGGTGLIRHSYEQTVMETECYYKSNLGTPEFPASSDQEGIIAVSVFCPVWRGAGQEALCQQLLKSTVSSKIVLFSGNTSTVLSLSNITTNSSAQDPSRPNTVMTSSLTSTQGSLRPPSPTSTRPSPLTVCTVQTYTSPNSGPMLWLFAHYYHLIGFQVVIYDRYGRHKSFLKDLIEQGAVQYHPYTSFQLARPDVYDALRAEKEGTGYKTYYRNENPQIIATGLTGKVAFKGAYDVASDTLQQDRDKALTLDGARLQYGRQSRVFLAVDCDEFLVPEGKAPWTVEGFKAELLQKHFSEKALGSVEEVQLLRKSVAGVPSEKETPWVMNLTDKVDHSRNFYKLSRCLQEGYGNRSLVSMSRCFGSYSVMYDRFSKFIDTRQTCSFHYIHGACNKPRKPPTKAFIPYNVTHLSKKHLGYVISDCFCTKKKWHLDRLFLAHLNHNHFLTVFRKPGHPKVFTQQGPNSITLALQQAMGKGTGNRGAT